MTFKLEYIGGTAVENSPEYKYAMEQHFGMPVSSRLHDEHRLIDLYELAISSSQERPPGLVILFLSGRPINVHLYRFAKELSNQQQGIDYLVCSIQPLSNLDMPEAGFIDILAEALSALEKTRRRPIDHVNVSIASYGGLRG